jgi:hypothetical protein
MPEFNELYDRPIPREIAQSFVLELQKLAVSTAWVSNAARAAAQNAGHQRVGEVGSRSMKGVLEAVKRKAPQATIDKRMALHQAVQGGGGRLSVSSSPPAALRKAAALVRAKLAEKRFPQSKLAAAVQAVKQRLGDPSAEDVISAEQEGVLQQALAENEALRAELDESGQLVEQHAQAADQAGMAHEQTAQQLEMAQQTAQQHAMEAQQAMGEAQQAMLEAQSHATEAARQADAKMRLGIRIQQMRQSLADMAAQDPVAEEGESADPILTAQQGGGAGGVDPSLAQDPAAQGQDPAAAAQGAPPEAAAPPPAMQPAQGEEEAAVAPPAKAKGAKTPKTEIKIGGLLPFARAAFAHKVAAAAQTLTKAPSTESVIGVGNSASRKGHRAATLQHAIRGAAAGYGLGALQGKHRGALTAAGTALGALHGGVSHAREENVKDLAAMRGLLKEQIGRKMKDGEKSASNVRQIGSVLPQKAKGVVGRAKELLTGAHAKALEDAAHRAAERIAKGNNKRPIGTHDRAHLTRLKNHAGDERLFSRASQIGVGGTGIVGAGHALDKALPRDDRKKQAAFSLPPKERGIKRFGQLLIGKREVPLLAKAFQAADVQRRARELVSNKGHGVGGKRKAEELLMRADVLHGRAHRDARDEQLKAFVARAGAATAVTAGVRGAKKLHERSREKKAELERDPYELTDESLDLLYGLG